jgi:hypothetical protein
VTDSASRTCLWEACALLVFSVALPTARLVYVALLEAFAHCKWPQPLANQAQNAPLVVVLGRCVVMCQPLKAAARALLLLDRVLPVGPVTNLAGPRA